MESRSVAARSRRGPSFLHSQNASLDERLIPASDTPGPDDQQACRSDVDRLPVPRGAEELRPRLEPPDTLGLE